MLVFNKHLGGEARWMLQAGLFKRDITTPTSVLPPSNPTYSQPRDQGWPNQAIPVHFSILLGDHRDYQETKVSLAQVSILKRKGEIYIKFQGQSIFGDTLLQGSLLFAKMKWVIISSIYVSVMRMTRRKKPSSPGINYCEVAQCVL